jgi:Tfp pilus assembly protein PilF
MKLTRPSRLALAIAAASLVLAACASTGKKKAADNESDPKYQYEKGIIAYKYGLADEAIRYTELAVSLDPKFHLAYNLMGLAYSSKGDHVKAAAAYAKAVEAKPDYVEGWNNLGTARTEAGDPAGATEAFRTSYDLDKNAKASYGLARALFERKAYQEALDMVRASIAADNQQAVAYNLEGAVLNALGRPGEAVPSFRTALSLAPEDVTIRINLGLAHVNNGENEKGLAELEKALPKIQDPVLKARVEEYIKALKVPG